MIVFDNVWLRYHYDEFDLLKGASFSLVDGVNTVLCDYQSGKSSICKLLIRDFSPSNGRIFLDGQDVASITNANLDILYLPAKPAFFERRSVLYNVQYPLALRKVPKAERFAQAKQVAIELGVEDLNAKVKSLPTNERRRVALARGLTVKRKTVLFDDFFENNAQVDASLNLFSGATCVIFTSNPTLARGNVVVLDGGVAVYQGNAEGARALVEQLGWLANEDLVNETRS